MLNKLFLKKRVLGNILMMDRTKVQHGEQLDFDDSSWKSGAAPLGYSASENRPMFGTVNTVINYGPDSSNKIPTYYFRTTFEVEDLAKIGDVGHINFGIDDSVILYLNGTRNWQT